MSRNLTKNILGTCRTALGLFAPIITLLDNAGILWWRTDEIGSASAFRLSVYYIVVARWMTVKTLWL